MRKTSKVEGWSAKRSAKVGFRLLDQAAINVAQVIRLGLMQQLDFYGCC